jgi:sigma-B regulation protein RsbU (phosphoserine phosphatase)
VNRSLLDLSEQGMFVTVFYATLDTTSGKLIYARAGHDHPLLLRNGSAIALGGRGALLGLFDDAAASLTEETIGMIPGDRLILYTDGLTDAVDTQGEMMGADRLSELFLARSALAADAIAIGIAGALRGFQANAEQTDDMTLLVVSADG